MLYGRVAEQDQIDRMLASARTGASSALVVHGEAGIGKTALLDYAATAATAASGQVLRTVGIESEMELAFGGLHQLLRPVVDVLDRLPEPQAAALKAAFGMTGEAVRDRFTVSLAVLTTLSEAASDGPLLCLIDDAQWLDQASLDALTFAARRLHAEGVVMLFAVRDGARGAQITGLPRLRLAGLDGPAVDALLAHRAAGLSPYVRAQIIAQAGGNPLALLELPAALTAEQRAGQLNPVTFPAGLSSASNRIQEAFAEQIRQLPAATRATLLTAAADDTGDLGLVLRAAARLGGGLEDLEPAERATLVRLTESTLSFRHPLIRSAAYQDAPLAQRFAAHRALADELRADGQSDRRAWHLAAATTGIEESVSEEMEGVARRAGGRQALASASAAYERAAQLTADPARRARLLAAAAITSAEGGQFDRLAALADRINALALDPATLADFARVRAIVELDLGTPSRAARIVIECVDRIGSGPDLRPLLSYAVHIAHSAADQELMAEVAARLPAGPGYATMRALTRPLGAEPHPADRQHSDGRHPDGQHPDRQPPDGHAGFAERILAGTRAQLFADRSGALEIAAACVQDCRDQDVVGWLHVSLHLLALAQLSTGRYEDAAAAATEGLTVAEHDGRDHRATYLRAALATVAALTGAEEQCRSFAGTALDHAGAHDIESAAAQARRALALLDLGSGHADSALEHLQAALERVSHPLLSVFLLPDLVEAAVRAGQRDRAEEPVTLVERWAAVAGAPDAAALASRCRALTAPDELAEQHFTAALREHDDGADPFEQGRTELLYGEWLRRARRRSEARRHLRAALETFERLGAHPWANRTRAELQASGESLDQTAASGTLLGRLSPQEREVVRLAATGATNREIASQLFLSPRTVGHHLYRAFPKLGISSRTELSQILD